MCIYKEVSDSDSDENDENDGGEDVLDNMTERYEI